MGEKVHFDENTATDFNQEHGIDTSTYELNLNTNSEIYEEQQQAAQAVNTSHGWRSWFRKK